jgi:GTP cyclohydrolase I
LSAARSDVEAAVDALLRAVGRDPSREPELRGTARRVAKALREDLLDGYGADPEEALGKLVPQRGESLVSIRGIRFHSMCPHHLLPYRGTLDLVYRPTRFLAGFSGLVRLVDLWAHRLILQEEITEAVAKDLVRRVRASGAAVRVAAEQACMIVRGPKRDGTRVVSFHFEGDVGRREGLAALGPEGRA